MGVYQQILEGKVLFPKWVDAGAKDLCKKLLTKDLTRRFGCLKVRLFRMTMMLMMLIMMMRERMNE